MAISYTSHAAIKGTVRDSQDNPIGYANVTLWQDTLFVAGTVSDNEGHFSFSENLPSSNRLRVSIIGFNEFIRNISETDQDILVVLESKDSILEEVVVLGNLPSHKMIAGGISTKVQNTTLSLLGNAMDVIAQQPGVRSYNGVIEVFGKGVPEIYVNGRKLNNYNELYSLSSNEIEKIEVLSNPGAKYGAEVRSVILVKTIRKQGDGLSGTVNGGIRIARYLQQSDNASLNYRIGNVDIFSQFAFEYARRYQSQQNDMTIVSGGNTYNLLSDISIRPQSTSYNFAGGINWRVSAKHSLGVRYEFQGIPSNPSVWITHENEKINGIETSYTDYDTNWERRNFPTNIVNAYYSGTFGKVSVAVNNDFYSNRNTASQSILETNSAGAANDIHSNNKINSTLFASKGIVEYKVASNTIEGGYYYIWTDRKDNYWNTNSSLPDAQDRIKEQTIAAFVGITIPVKELEFYGSLRYEHTNSDYYQQNIYIPGQSREYNRLCPSIDFSFPISKVNFTLSYSAKTKRPRYDQLSSSIQYDDRYTYETGNPFLRPELNHDISLAGLYKWIFFSASYQYVSNAIIGVVDAYKENEPINLMTFTNYDHVSKYSIVLSLSPRISAWSPRLRFNLLGQRLSTPSISGNKHLNNPLLFINFYNSINLGNGFTATGDVLCRTHGDMDIVTMKPSWQINLGVTKTHKGWYFQINATDIFKTARNSMRTYGRQMVLNKCNYSDSQAIRFTIRYSFNSTMSRYKGKSAAQEEKARL
jgi:hypothetical protein